MVHPKKLPVASLLLVISVVFILLTDVSRRVWSKNYHLSLNFVTN